jgi:hypothetical protein
LAGTGIAAVLTDALASEPLQKPADHRGGDATNMYLLRLSVAQREAIVRLVRAARDAGAVTSETTQRGLGGFVEAWQEYLDWESTTQKGEFDER